jgi:hypothetical protein
MLDPGLANWLQATVVKPDVFGVLRPSFWQKAWDKPGYLSRELGQSEFCHIA